MLLTTKERDRIDKVRHQLSIGENPYAYITDVTDKPNKQRKASVPEARPIQRFRKSRIASHRWGFIDGRSDNLPEGIVRCATCDHEIIGGRLNGIFCKYIVQVVKDKIITWDVNRDTEVEKTIIYPIHHKGYVCKTCWNDMGSEKLEIGSETVRLMEACLTTEKIDHNRRYRMEARDNLRIPKNEITSVTKVFRAKDGSEEEWKVSLPRPPKQPVHVGGYRRFGMR
jgi:hypothetical protein